jgi:hypothetical protein
VGTLTVTVFTALSGTMRGVCSEDVLDWRVFALLSSAIAPSTLARVAVREPSPRLSSFATGAARRL